MGGYAFLAGRHEMESEKPLVERDFAIFHHGSDRDRERLVALVAPMNARSRAFSSKLGYACRIGVAAMAANRAVRPIEAFKMLARLVGIAENRVCQKRGHGLVLG